MPRESFVASSAFALGVAMFRQKLMLSSKPEASASLRLILEINEGVIAKNRIARKNIASASTQAYHAVLSVTAVNAIIF